jgi:hypothetical protein
VVFEKLVRSEELTLPNLGNGDRASIHIDDLAQKFMKTPANWSSAVGESIHIVFPAVLIVRCYAKDRYP